MLDDISGFNPVELRRVVFEVSDASPGDLLRIVESTGLAPEDVEVTIVATRIMRLDPPPEIGRALENWALRFDLRWCAGGGHWTDENPCSEHER